ncbi:UvrB/UvrC motif-containing protein [Macrococcus carouselicus]|uniref:Excinuclease ABC subunit B n=1 Tax=Macrococcus carouselicus TaxID=69969 RepID=A0A9Q8FPH6_9STAP|nr:UvrB/UvrC motif-containing protein [Macrococcus carouselicus]TDM00902.1 excinuclease ABC subunit B [Macrococcus carouselicus]
MKYNDDEFTMNQLLKHLLREEQTEPVCPDCGLTLREALHIGKFGCHTCYSTFSEYVPQIVERVQAGNHKHVGQAPLKSAEKIQRKKRIEELGVKLQELVEEQAFEEAVIVRDEIKALKERGESDAG